MVSFRVSLKRVSGHRFLPAEHFASYFRTAGYAAGTILAAVEGVFEYKAGLLWHVIQLPECDFRHLFWIPETLWKMLVLKGSKRKSKFSSFCMKYQSLYSQNHWNRKRIWLCPISGISRAQGQRDSSASCGFGPDYSLKVTAAATKPRQIYISRHNLFLSGDPVPVPASNNFDDHFPNVAAVEQNVTEFTGCSVLLTVTFSHMPSTSLN